MLFVMYCCCRGGCSQYSSPSHAQFSHGVSLSLPSNAGDLLFLVACSSVTFRLFGRSLQLVVLEFLRQCGWLLIEPIRCSLFISCIY